jgi:ribonuclease HII
MFPRLSISSHHTISLRFVPDLLGMNEPLIIGVDEVGRGCVLGPLVVAAVANPRGWHDKDVKDSKAYSSEKKRKAVSDRIRDSVTWHMASVPADHIDKHGITPCLNRAMILSAGKVRERIRTMVPGATFKVIMDGSLIHQVVAELSAHDTSFDAFPKADAKVFEVSAASVLAKVYRDSWITALLQEFPEMAGYDLASNKGYGTDLHTRNLFLRGLTKFHRATFCESLLQNYRTKKAAASAGGNS